MGGRTSSSIFSHLLSSSLTLLHFRGLSQWNKSGLGRLGKALFNTRSLFCMEQGKRNATGQRAAWCLLERLLHVLPEIPDQGKEAASLMPSLMEKVFAEISAPDREVGSATFCDVVYDVFNCRVGLYYNELE